MREWEISNIIEALWAHGQHVRAHAKDSKIYAPPIPPAETLERASLLIEQLTGVKGLRPIWDINKGDAFPELGQRS